VVNKRLNPFDSLPVLVEDIAHKENPPLANVIPLSVVGH
jgi:hypothetical protein